MADAHSKQLPEPLTPMWLPALGATLFLLAGIWWAWTSSTTHVDGTSAGSEGKPAASARP